MAEFYGTQSPGAYDPVQLEKIKQRSPKWDHTRSKLDRFAKTDSKDLSPSPDKYSPDLHRHSIKTSF